MDSITLAGPSPTSAASVDFTVTFSEAVTGVDASDFSLTSTVTGASITTVTATADAAVYTVTVDTGSGDGTIRLDVVDNGSILDASSNPLAGGFTGGEEYTIIGLAEIKVHISDLLERSYTLTSGEERREYYDVSGGPVVVDSLDSTKKIVAAIRLQSMPAVGPLYSFVENHGSAKRLVV